MQVAKRAAGSFAIARASTASTAAGRSGRAALAGGGGAVRWAVMIASWLARGNGTSPVRHSYATQASEYWSLAAVTTDPRVSCSGEQYAMVPTISPVPVSSVSSSSSRLMPKSTSVTAPARPPGATA